MVTEMVRGLTKSSSATDHKDIRTSCTPQFCSMDSFIPPLPVNPHRLAASSLNSSLILLDFDIHNHKGHLIDQKQTAILLIIIFYLEQWIFR